MSFLGDPTLLLNRLVRITIGGDLAVSTAQGPAPSPDIGCELREDGGVELREDGGIELRDVNDAPVFNEIEVQFRSETSELQYLAEYQAYQNAHFRPVPVIAIGGTFDPSNCSSLITLSAGNKVARANGSGFSAVLTTNTWYGPSGDRASVVEFQILTGSTANYYVGSHLMPYPGYAGFTPDADMQGTNSVVGYREDGTVFDTTGERGGPYIPLVSGDILGILGYGELYFFLNGEIIPGIPSLTAGPPGIVVYPMFARIES